MQKKNEMLKNACIYFLLSTVFWFAVDYTTVFNPYYQRWFDYMPDILLFYFGYPLVFTVLIYALRLNGWKLAAALIIGLFIVEIVFTRNALLYTFPIMLVMVPLSVCIYTFITIVPKWIVEGRLRENRLVVIGLTAVWLIVAALSWITRLREGPGV